MSLGWRVNAYTTPGIALLILVLMLCLPSTENEVRVNMELQAIQRLREYPQSKTDEQ